MLVLMVVVLGGGGGCNRQSKGESVSSGNSEEICAEGEGRREGKRKARTEGIDTADEEEQRDVGVVGVVGKREGSLGVGGGQAKRERGVGLPGGQVVLSLASD